MIGNPFEGFNDVGKYQWMCLIIYGITCGAFLQSNVAILFTAPNEIQFYCNDEAEAFSNLTWDEQKKVMTVFGRCNRPDVNLSTYTREELLEFNVSSTNKSRVCDTGFVYDHTYMDYTLTEQFDLVCGRKWMVEMTKTMYMVGFFIGALLSGVVSDRFGRKPTFVIFGTGTVLMNLVLAFPPNAEMFIAVRCVLGLFGIGFHTTGLILHTELVRKEERKLPRSVVFFSTDLAVLFFVAVTLGLRDYRFLQLYIGCSMAVFLAVVCIIVPESSRWLVTQGRMKEAAKICKRIAKFNRWPEEKMSHLLVIDQEEETQDKKNFTHLFMTPILRRRTILLCLMWFCHVMAFFAIIFNMGTFYPDLRLGMVISNVIELPSTLIPMMLIDSVGRQLSSVIFLFFGGLACIAMGPTILFQEVPARGSKLMLGLAVFGKLMLSRQFFISYIYGQELMPTVLRSQGLGLCSTMSRIGGMIAPQIILLDDLWPATSVTTLGTVALLAGVLVVALPDTTGAELPQCIADGEGFKPDHVYKLDWPRKRSKQNTSNVNGDVDESPMCKEMKNLKQNESI